MTEQSDDQVGSGPVAPNVHAGGETEQGAQFAEQAEEQYGGTDPLDGGNPNGGQSNPEQAGLDDEATANRH